LFLLHVSFYFKYATAFTLVTNCLLALSKNQRALYVIAPASLLYQAEDSELPPFLKRRARIQIKVEVKPTNKMR
jgi:hypothetical protein